MTEQPCSDPFHKGAANGEAYEIPGPGDWVTTGNRCPSCGFQTVTVETYEPLVKPCPQCARDFEGMADEPTEICDDCALKNVTEWARGAGPSSMST